MKYITITFAIIMLVCICGFIYMHEVTHREIFRSYGINSTIEYTKDGPYTFITRAEAPCPTSSCILAQNNADIFGYHLLPIMLSIGCGLFLIIFLMEDRLEHLKKNVCNENN